jgi:TonB family protein
MLDSTAVDDVHILKGELVSLSAHTLTRVSVSNPSVADIVKAEENEILLVGQGAGQTALFIWDADGKRTLMVYVTSQDLAVTKDRLEKLLKAVNIEEVILEINEQEGKIVVSGDIPAHKKEQFDQVVGSFGEDVVNLAKKEEIEDLIQIDVQITELSTSLSKSLGIDWSTGTQTTSGNNITTTSSGGFIPVYGEIFPALDGSVGDYFKIGQFQRTSNSALIATINALVDEGEARILSQPKLVVVNGEEASFLVGGQIPIRTTTSSGSTAQENVVFRQYGISMTITPEIKKEKIGIVFTVEVSDIDAANAVGDDVAYTTRSAQTQLYLDEGETIVLAGLIKQNRSQSISKVPFLGDIPVVGLLFRNKSNPAADQDLELVISLTPTILAKNRSSERAAGADKNKTPASEGDVGRVGGLDMDSGGKIAPRHVAIPKEMEEYVSSVQQKIAQAIMYPQEAQRHGWEGTVKLGLLILNDGTLATALVKESSGHEILDENALKIAQNNAPYAIFPADTDLKELNVTIPIVYSLKKKN